MTVECNLILPLTAEGWCSVTSENRQLKPQVPGSYSITGLARLPVGANTLDKSVPAHHGGSLGSDAGGGRDLTQAHLTQVSLNIIFTFGCSVSRGGPSRNPLLTCGVYLRMVDLQHPPCKWRNILNTAALLPDGWPFAYLCAISPSGPSADKSQLSAMITQLLLITLLKVF